MSRWGVPYPDVRQPTQKRQDSVLSLILWHRCQNVIDSFLTPVCAAATWPTTRYHHRMNLRLEPPPPLPPDSPSALLMRALGDLQMMEGGEPITDIETVGLMCGVVWTDLAALIEVGITVGYLEAQEFGGALGLSAKGQRWYERGRPLGSMLRRE